MLNNSTKENEMDLYAYCFTLIFYQCLPLAISCYASLSDHSLTAKKRSTEYLQTIHKSIEIQNKIANKFHLLKIITHADRAEYEEFLMSLCMK